jgi:hypothetical protein
VPLHDLGSAAHKFSPTRKHPHIDQRRNAHMPFHVGPKKYAHLGDSSVNRLGIVLSRHHGHRDKSVSTRSKIVQRPDLDSGLSPARAVPLPPPLLLRIARGSVQLTQAPSDHLYQVQGPASPICELQLHLQDHHYSSQSPISGHSNSPLKSMGSFDREALIDRMVRLIIDPANPQIARNIRTKQRSKRA